MKEQTGPWEQGVLSEILDRMPSNLCCLAASQEFVLHGTTWEEALGAQEEELSSKDALILEPQLQGLGTVCRCLGALCLHSAEVRG